MERRIIDLVNDQRAVELANDVRAAAARLKQMDLLEQARLNARANTLCGPPDDYGRCRSAYHTMQCANANMTSASTRATFARADEPGYQAAWDAAREERRRMHEMLSSPAQLEAEREKERKAADTAAEKQRRAAMRETGANWATTRRGTAWLENLRK